VSFTLFLFGFFGHVLGWMLISTCSCRMPPFVYKPEGQAVARQLYEETLDEFASDGLRVIIDNLAAGTQVRGA